MLWEKHRTRLNGPDWKRLILCRGRKKTITKAQSGSTTPAPSGTGLFREDGMKIAKEDKKKEDWFDQLSNEELEKELNQMESYYRSLGVID